MGEIIIYKTNNVEQKKKLMKILEKNQISFHETTKRVPIKERKEYDGAKEIGVYYISEYYADRVDEILTMMKDK
ncbi:MAG: hypothetical protein PHS74_05720 [Lachnospiraceae bacterium]|nr:hypothetical protein [Lachnospiraceae bacterium]